MEDVVTQPYLQLQPVLLRFVSISTHFNSELATFFSSLGQQTTSGGDAKGGKPVRTNLHPPYCLSHPVKISCLIWTPLTASYSNQGTKARARRLANAS